MPAEKQTWPPALVISPIVGTLTSVGRECVRDTVKKVKKKNEMIVVFVADENYGVHESISGLIGVMVRHVRLPDVARYGKRSNVMRNADLLMRAVQSCGEVFLLALQDSPSNRHLVKMCENKDLTIFDHRGDGGMVEAVDDITPRNCYDDDECLVSGSLALGDDGDYE